MKYTALAQIENQLLSVGEPRLLCLAGAEDEHALCAVKELYEKGLLTPVLVGAPEGIRKAADAVGLELNGIKIFPAFSPDDSAQRAAELIRDGAAQILMKGKLETAQLLRPVAKKENGLNPGGVMSHFVWNELPSYHKLIASSDGGMLPYPTLEQKRAIIQNCVNVLHALGIENPKVAVLACTERVNPKMPETVEADELKSMNLRDEIGGCIVEGPISLDLAISAEKARLKGYSSPVAGDADVLISPNIHAGNILGKAMLELAGGKMAGIVVGAKCPIVMTSRGSSSEEKYFSILLACAAAGR